MEQKIEEIFFVFQINAFELGVAKSSIRYLPLPVNVLRNAPKISGNSRRNIFQINFSQDDEKKWENSPHGDFPGNRDSFTCWLSKRVPKRRFLQSCLTKFFTVCNFRNTLAMTIIFFFKLFKISCRFHKWNKNSEKVFRFSDDYIWIGSSKFWQSWTGYMPSQSIC